MTFLDRVLTTIDHHLTDADLDIQALANRLAVSRSHLYRQLAAHGVRPARLIRNRRLERAAELLADEEMPVGNAAFAVGFKSFSHFSYCFKIRFGASPSAYRARVLRELGLREAGLQDPGQRVPGISARAGKRRSAKGNSDKVAVAGEAPPRAPSGPSRDPRLRSDRPVADPMTHSLRSPCSAALSDVSRSLS